MTYVISFISSNCPNLPVIDHEAALYIIFKKSCQINGLNFCNCPKNRALILISSYMIPNFYSEDVKIYSFLWYILLLK